MCDLVTAGMAGLQAIGSFSAISNQNEAAMANDAQAKVAMNDQQATTTEQYIEQQRSLIQGGFDAILEGRAAESEAFTSAIENGAAGNSMRAVLSSRRQKTNRSAERTSQEMDSLRNRTGASLKHIRSRAVGRSNSVATTKFGIGDLAKIAAPIVRSQTE